MTTATPLRTTTGQRSPSGAGLSTTIQLKVIFISFSIETPCFISYSLGMLMLCSKYNKGESSFLFIYKVDRIVTFPARSYI